MTDWQDEYDEAVRAPLRAEIERLRAALRLIKETYGPNHGSKFCWKVACDVLEADVPQQPAPTHVALGRAATVNDPIVPQQTTREGK